MPFALVIIGLAMLISAARNTNVALGNQLVADFTGSGNFTYWLVALGAVGSVGYIDKFKPLSHAFMFLLIVSFTIKNHGVFDQLTAAIQSGPVAPDQNAKTASSAANDNSNTNLATGLQGDVNSVAQSVQSGIVNNGSKASQNFQTTAKVAQTLITMFA